MLRSKSILAPVSAEDGLRISVMSRHTLRDGKTPDTRITSKMYDEWWPSLAPPPNLIGDYYKRDLPWNEFSNQYLNYLERQDTQPYVHQLARLASQETVTIMCIEEEPGFCHRRLLAEICQNTKPRLSIEIR